VGHGTLMGERIKYKSVITCTQGRNL